jgi:hypothetical protein
MKKAGLEYKEAANEGSFDDATEEQRPLGIRREKLSQPVSELSEQAPDPTAVSLTRSLSTMNSPVEASAVAEAASAAAAAAEVKAADGKKRPPTRQGSKADLAAVSGMTNPPSSAPSAASTPRNAERYSGYYGGDHGLHGVNQKQLLESRRLTLKKRDRGVPFSAQYPALPLPGPTDDETAPLIALWYEHDGDLKKMFAELGESPRKALKNPPTDALDFANKFIAGKLTDYASPKVKPGFEEQLMAPDRNSTPLQTLEAIFPSLPHEVLYAVLEAANGSLERAVQILLESGASLFDEDEGSGGTASKDPTVAASFANGGAAGGGGDTEDVDTGLSAMQQRRLEEEQQRIDQERAVSAAAAAAGDTAPAGKQKAPPRRSSKANAAAMLQPAVPPPKPPAPPPVEEDFVLAITVPMGSKPNALLKITTTIGTVHARVPQGVKPGQSFFIRMRRGATHAQGTTGDPP